MKKSIVFILFLIPCYTFCQSITIVQVKSKFGLMENGQMTVKPKYDSIRAPQEGMYAFLKGKKWGFMNAQGEEVISSDYLKVKDFHHGIAAVQSNTYPWNWGFINTKGQEIAALRYTEVVSFAGNFGLIKHGHMPDDWALINQKGEWLFKRVSFYQQITDNRYLVGDNADLLNQGYFYIDSTGKAITPVLLDKVFLKTAPAVVSRESDRKVTLLDISCKQLCDWYESIEIHASGSIIAKKDYGEFVLLGDDYQPVQNKVFKSLRFSEDVLLAKPSNSDQEYLVNRKGDFISEPFFFIRDFKNGIAVITTKNKGELESSWYFISSEGKRLNGPYKHVTFFQDRPSVVFRLANAVSEYAYANDNGAVFSQWYPMVISGKKCDYRKYSDAYGPNRFQVLLQGFMETVSGAALIKGLGRGKKTGGADNVQYEYFFDGDAFADNRAIVSRKGEREYHEKDSCFHFTDNASFGYIDTTGKEVIPCKFQRAWNFQKGYAKVKYKGGFGMITLDGTFTVPAEYEVVEYFPYYGGVIVTKNGKSGVVSIKNESILPLEFDKIDFYSATKIKVLKDGQWYYVDNKGKRME